jgi:heme-degrading monooxygenase HmoA
MIVSMFHVQVPETAIAGFERSWTQRAGRVDAMPGFRDLEVLKDGSQAGAYIVLTHWETKEDYERWANSPDFAAAHARPGTAGAQGGGVSFYEVLPS